MSRPAAAGGARLRWCFSTLGCGELDLDGVLALALEHGIRDVELRMIEGQTDLPTLFARRFGEPSRLAGRLSEAGVRVAVLDTSFALVGGDETDREALLAFVPWAEAIGAPWLRVFDGGEFRRDLRDEVVDEAADAVRWWRERRRRGGWSVDVAIETHDALCTTDACLRLQCVLDAPAAILWDAHHIWFNAGEDPLETWASLRPYVRHVHVKDSVREPILHYPYTYCLPGQGELPLEALLGRLSAEGFDGCVSLEWERAWHPYLPELYRALEATRRWRG